MTITKAKNNKINVYKKQIPESKKCEHIFMNLTLLNSDIKNVLFLMH